MALLKLLKNTLSKERVMIKRIPDLSPVEREQVEQLFKQYYPEAKDSYIKRRTQTDLGFDLVLIKAEGAIKSASYYDVRTVATPFAKKPIPIVYFGQALKKRGYKGNVIWRSGVHYALEKLGWRFPLKKALGISTVINPRVYEQFMQLYPHLLSHDKHPFSKSLPAFLNHYFQVECSLPIQVDDDFCYTFEELGEEDITDDWERVYKTKNESINQLFFDKGIMVRKNGRTYKTGKHLVVCGYRGILDQHRLQIDVPKLTNLN